VAPAVPPSIAAEMQGNKGGAANSADAGPRKRQKVDHQDNERPKNRRSDRATKPTERVVAAQ